jgi:DNA-binding Lrp family transcriptional regulator
MDALDLEILCLLHHGARVAHASVGERLGLTAQAVHARIKRLEAGWHYPRLFDRKAITR